MDQADEVIRSLGRLAVMPMVARRVLDALRDPDRLSAQALASHIAHDPALCAQVLREANSVYYGGLEVKELLGAIVVIGFNRAAELTLASSCVQAFGPSGDVRSRFAWRRGLLVATAACRLARATFGGGGDVLFAAGLMHDLGRAVLRQRYPEVEREAFKHIYERDAYRAAKKACGVDPADLAAALARAWNLPAEARFVMSRHHDPDALIDERATRDERLSLLFVLIGKALADSVLALRPRRGAFIEALAIAESHSHERQLYQRLPSAIERIEADLFAAIEREDGMSTMLMAPANVRSSVQPQRLAV